MKKIVPLILAVFFVVLLIIAFLSRTTLNNFISKKMKEQSGTENKLIVEKLIDLKYNYTKNNQNYDFTLIEFGSTGCTICKQMEPVLEEIRKTEKPKVNVVFLNIMHPENLSMMKYFGISAVPMQILLDKSGKEFYRHYGFISAEELIRKFS
ncbi:MAG TPA: thioredoxin family protein [Draconibacterium sp.]|nr:thioredoxin family protein [Draconibacterium sp.]